MVVIGLRAGPPHAACTLLARCLHKRPGRRKPACKPRRTQTWGPEQVPMTLPVLTGKLDYLPGTRTCGYFRGWTASHPATPTHPLHLTDWRSAPSPGQPDPLEKL
ncbi:uncharacterized protein LOC144284212 [Canis aureus]